MMSGTDIMVILLTFVVIVQMVEINDLKKKVKEIECK